MKNPKFHLATLGIDPVVDSNSVPLNHKDAMVALPQHLRRHSSTGVIPAVDAPAKVLQRNPEMAKAAFELSAAHYEANVGGLDSPSRGAIEQQTPVLAESIGLTNTATPARDSVKFGKKRTLK